MTERLLAEYKIVLTIPFPNSQLAKVNLAVLGIDKEPNRNFVTKIIQVIDDNLIINFSGSVSRNLRVAVSSFLESLILCSETMQEFEIRDT